MGKCLDIFTSLSDRQTLGQILQLHSELRTVRSDLVEVIKRTRIQVSRAEELRQFAGKIEALSDVEKEKALLRQMKDAQSCLQAFRQLIDLLTHIKETSLEDAQACVNAVAQLTQTEAARIERLEQLKAYLLDGGARPG